MRKACWILAAASATLLIAAPLHAQADKRSSSLHLSPDGKWLVMILEQMQEIKHLTRGEGKSYQKTGQWIFRVSLLDEKPKPQLLHRLTGPKLKLGQYQYSDAAIRDDGTALAIKEGPLELTRWDASLKRSEKKIFGSGNASFLRLHLRPDGKELFIHRDLHSSDDSRTETERLDLESQRLDHLKILDGVMAYDFHWSADLKYVFGAVEAPRDRSRSEAAEKHYELVRVDLATGDRKVISSRVWFYGNCFGPKWITWNHKEKDRKGIFWKANISDPFEPAELPGFEDWEPVFSVDEKRVLCRSLDWKRHAIIDLEPSDEAAGTTDTNVHPIELPHYQSNKSILYSRALKSIVLSQEALQVELWDLGGKLLKKIKLDLQAQVKSKG